MSATSTQATNQQGALLGSVTTRFIRPGRGRAWEGLRVLPVVVATAHVTDRTRQSSALTN